MKMHLLAISYEFSFPKLHFYVAFKTLVLRSLQYQFEKRSFRIRFRTCYIIKPFLSTALVLLCIFDGSCVLLRYHYVFVAWPQITRHDLTKAASTCCFVRVYN